MADDKPNSVLTNKQREYLRKSDEEQSEDYTRQGRSYHRKEIQKRARQAFYDFALLYHGLGEDERNQIFDPPREEVASLGRAIEFTIAFLYRSLQGEYGERDLGGRSFDYSFDHFLEEGIKRGETDRLDLSAYSYVEYEPAKPTVRRWDNETNMDHIVEELAKNGGRNLTDEELRSAIFWATDGTKKGDWYIENTDGEDEQVEALTLRRLAEEVERKVEELQEESDE